MKKKVKSSYKEFIKNKKQKKLLDKEYRDLLISKLLLERVLAFQGLPRRAINSKSYQSKIHQVVFSLAIIDC